MIKAVIYDMFETLITHYESFLYFARDIAIDANIPVEEFVPLWLQSEDARTLGYLSFEDALESILLEYDCYSEELVEKIYKKRIQCKYDCFDHLHPQIIPMLDKLKEKKIKIGLITNCYLEEEKVIRESALFPYFDSACLSCNEGLMKPDIKIFDRCCERMNVKPEECLYVGDGGSYELETAQALGMQTLQATWYFKEGTVHFVKRKEEFLEAAKPLDVIEYIEKNSPKKLSDMSLEELWQLFPIFLVEHKPQWKQWYEDEEKNLQSFLPADVIMNHIGSTAINDIWAKNIVDILIEIPYERDIRDIKKMMTDHGYICMSEEKNRISFNKGYTVEGFAERVFHIHVRYKGDNDEILFRNYLNSHPEKAKEYEKLKLGLWKEYEHDRDGYTEAKTDFIKEIMLEARLWSQK